MNKLIQFPVTELKTALTGLSKVTGRSSYLPVLQTIRVTRDGNGIVNLRATDLESFGVYQPTEPQPGPACDFLVPTEPLARLLKNSAGSIHLIPQARHQVILRSFLGGSPVDKTVEAPELEEWPPMPEVAATPILLNEEFRAAVAAALACCNEETSRPALKGAWVDVTDPKAHYVLGTDGRHLVTTNSFCLDLPKSILIPHTKFSEWKGFLDDGDWKLALREAKNAREDGWLQLQSDHWTFLAKQTTEKCVNWRQCVPASDRAATSIRLSDEARMFLLDVLPKLPGYDDVNQPMVFDAAPPTLRIKGRARSAEWTAVDVPGATITGGPMTIHVCRDYVLKALKFGLTQLDLYDPLSPLVFHSGGQRIVIMPLNPNAPASATSPAPTASPSQSETTNPTEEKTPMPKATTTEANSAETAESPVKSLVQHVETIKESLKGVLRDLNDLLDFVKKTEREKKASEKEIEAVREKLREIQSVKI